MQHQASRLGDNARVVVQSLRTDNRTIVVDGGSAGRYVPTGHLVYAVGGTLLAVPFDVKRRQSTGAAVPVVERVVRPVVGPLALGSALFSVSDAGSLIYVAGDSSIAQSLAPKSLLAAMNRKGELEPLKFPAAAYEFPRVSPDGKRLAYDTVDGKDAIVWVAELSGATSPIRITFAGRNRYPIWTPDGQRIAFQSDREGDRGIFWQRADGSGTTERLTKAEAVERHISQAWSPSGDVLLFAATARVTSLQILSLVDKRVARFGDVQADTLFAAAASFSPDGRWVAYSVPDAGTSNVFVQPFPATGAKYQISREEAGLFPVWSRDGQELFYRSFSSSQQQSQQQRMASVTVTTRPSFTFTNPTTFEWRREPELGALDGRTYDVLPDGQHFIRLVSVSDQPQAGPPPNPPIQVVLNWFEELKQRVPTK